MDMFCIELMVTNTESRSNLNFAKYEGISPHTFSYVSSDQAVQEGTSKFNVSINIFCVWSAMVQMGQGASYYGVRYLSNSKETRLVM